MTNTSTVVVPRCYDANANIMAILNDNALHMGFAANASSGGAMPSTLGAITANAAQNAPVLKLQG